MRPIRHAYEDDGVLGFYARSGATYRNPHEPGVRAAVLAFAPRLRPGRVLDLACGSGEVTLALREAGVLADDVDGCDPYTGAAYRERTGRDAFPWAFEDLPSALAGLEYAAVVASFALHLCPRSRLPGVLQALALASPCLLVLSPHKRPVVRDGWGWTLALERYDPEWRVRSRWFVREQR